MAVLRRAPRKLVPLSVLVLTWAANGPAVADLSGPPVVWEVRGCREARLGAVLRPLDDVDGDGVPDLVVAAPEFPHVPRGWGYVAILSGRTGETLRRWASADPTVLYARALDVIGDVDGDGLRDVVVHDGRRLEVVSPVSGEVLYRLAELPGSVPGIFDRAGDLGDLDGDGVHDFFETNSTLFVGGAEVGRVAARSGRDGRLLWETLGGDELGALARSVVAVPDVTGDGVTDLVVGQSRGGADRPTGGLVLLSGVDGSVVEDFVPDPTLRAFGSRDLVLLGDEDGDGRVEVAVSAHLASEGRRVDVGWVGVFEIPDFRLSWSLYGPNARTERLRGSELGYRLAGAGDVDRDGVVDVLISTDNSRLKGLGTNFGRLYLRSGRSGQLLQVYEAAEQFGVYFSSLSALGDVDGDGQPEFAVAALDHVNDPRRRGVVQVLRYQRERPLFQRGDTNQDGHINVGDVVRVLQVMRGIQPVGSCPATHDTFVDGKVDLLDAWLLIHFLFSVTPRGLTPPFRECGRYARLPIPTVLGDPLECTDFAACP